MKWRSIIWYTFEMYAAYDVDLITKKTISEQVSRAKEREREGEGLYELFGITESEMTK